MSDTTQTQQPEKELHFLTVREVQAIKFLLEQEIKDLEFEKRIQIGCAKATKEQKDKTMFYEAAERRSKKIARLSKLQKSVKKFLTDPHV